MGERPRKVHSAIYSSTEIKPDPNEIKFGKGNVEQPKMTFIEKGSLRKEQEIKKRRKKNVKKLEQLEEKAGRRERQLRTTPGRRIFTLPGRLKPVGLFARIGSLQDDNEYIPIEFYDASLSGSSETDHLENSSPHPAAVFTKNLFHVGDEDYFRRQRTSEAVGVKVTGGKKQRPYSVQFPLLSALKKPYEKTRPKSLRILDPRDMKIYEPVRRNSIQLSVDTPTSEINAPMRRLKLDENEKYPRDYLQELGAT